MSTGTKKGTPIGVRFRLGFMYANGRGVPKDHIGDLRWYWLAAEQGDAGAQSNLGIMYVLGEGVPQDPVLAYMSLNLAAAQGLVMAGELRVLIAKVVNRGWIAQAQRLSREWRPKEKSQ